MHRLIEKLNMPMAAETTLTLTFAERCKGRLRVTLDNGEAAGVFLARGSTLQNGDVLRSDIGLTVQIRAAQESLSCVECRDPLLLARACYHLGNRHIPLQIQIERVSYLHDHVLDDMVRGLGLNVQHINAAFEPESGAYRAHSPSHSHSHEH